MSLALLLAVTAAIRLHNSQQRGKANRKRRRETRRIERILEKRL